MAMIDDAAADLRQTVAALQRELDRRTAERDEAVAQQTATSEILSVISRSPTDIQPVFEAIVARAASLCEAEFSAVARFQDGLLHLVALNNMSPEETAAFHSLFPRQPGQHFAMGRAFVDAQPVHLADVLADRDYDPRTIEVLQSVSGYRSFLAVPIFRQSKPIGVVGCGRREVQPFYSDADRAAEDLCRPSRGCDRERPPLRRAGGPQPRPRRGLGTADRDR
jgi:GAF domain-containing protein